MSRFLQATLACAAIIFFGQASAQPCGEVPAEYRQHRYAPALHAVLSKCSREFSQDEQMFIAGMSQSLIDNCGFPESMESRSHLAPFLTSASLVIATGGSRSGGLGEQMSDQMTNVAAYGAGGEVAGKLGCGQWASQLADNIVEVVSAAQAVRARSPYVIGCAQQYAGTYTEQQCQCVADVGSSAIPGLHEREFSSASFREIIQAYPFLGIQIAMQCGIGDY
ncbi:hypothetical protein M2318_005308 [Metapseudomonas resinovorans]|uniref:hypothetical protein n=1 Tax=Metapseudomonas resinovorans TaxID=53412 RepID=UPI003D1D8EF3